MRFAGLDPENREDSAILGDLQGNILSGHGRDHSALVLIDSRGALGREHPCRTWLRELQVTTALEQATQAQAFAAGMCAETGLFISIYLTASGYRRLGLPNRRLPGDIAFRQGAASRARSIGDGDFANWERWATGGTDVAILIATDDLAALDSKLDEIQARLADWASSLSISGILRGSVEREDELVRDKFGFADGLSQPLFLRRHIDRYRQSNSDSDLVWDPSADPRHLVLAPEIGGPGRFGSYLVVRKLAQKRDIFEDALQRISSLIGIDQSLAEAFVVGRHKDGSPVAEHAKPVKKPANNFTYDGDPEGGRCPFSAHSRRMNPRSEAPQDLGRQIARRGYTYADDESEGLIFLSFQQDISRQFEFLQRIWANSSPHDPLVDALIGASPRSFTWPTKWDAAPHERAATVFGASVQLMGGLYLFAPSIKFLREVF